MQCRNFYPRSPCGERLSRKSPPMCTIRHFYPRSPCGERPGKVKVVEPGLAFLSTLSLRRATKPRRLKSLRSVISIHALLAESDNLRVLDGSESSIISIHALLAESDATPPSPPKAKVLYFYPRSPCGERQHAEPAEQTKTLISIHALLAESDG